MYIAAELQGICKTWDLLLKYFKEFLSVAVWYYLLLSLSSVHSGARGALRKIPAPHRPVPRLCSPQADSPSGAPLVPGRGGV